MDFSFKAISLSYKTAPIHIRESISLDEQATRRLLAKSREVVGISEVLIISTCNRTEIYYSSEEDLAHLFIKLIGVEKGIFDIDTYTPYFQIINNPEEAIAHLFRVSIGLESQVVGDFQIINQVKNAYKWATEIGLAGTFLHRLLHTIFFTHKRVVQETAFRDGTASVSYATVEMIEGFSPQFANPKLLIIGLGEIGTDVVKNLSNTALKNVKIANRTAEKAATLANTYGFEAVSFEKIEQHIQEADFVVCAVHRVEPLISKEMMNNIRIVGFKYFFDLSIPRSIDPTIEHLNNVLLYNVDAINNSINEALERRKNAIPKVEIIINQAIIDFLDWTKEMIVSPVIQKLKNMLEEIRKEEMERYIKQLDANEIEKIDKITKSMMQKILKMPVIQLKAACRRGEAETLADVLTDLFDLEKKRVNI
ncbi:MAG: glutamyl-tRNA reductase [Cytophagales bacterium]|nr:MAG: glutamyl-tRNA reductase [Cytophagales bacterium]